MIERKGETDKSTITIGDSNTVSIIDRKISIIEDLNNTMDQLNWHLENIPQHLNTHYFQMYIEHSPKEIIFWAIK